MRRVRVLWLLLLLVACREKVPPEGAIRVAVKYGSYKPACVRVSVRDAQGHEGSTDILARDFQNTDTQEVLVAVFRKPEWERQLTLEVTSHDGSSGQACSGTLVEKHSTPEPLTVPPGEAVPFNVTLRAQDSDGDTFIHPEEGVVGTDCDDKLIDVYPGAPEKCVVGVDFDCDGDKACQDSQCVDTTCDDGDACTKDDRCQGSGASAVCQGQTVQCQQPTGVCFARAECSPATGECVNVKAPPETLCNDNNPCTLDDRCGPEAQCAGTDKVCNEPPTACFESLGMCKVATGICDYAFKPASASCNDSVECTVSDRCDGAGMCRGMDTPCMPSSVCHRVTGGCVALNNCTEEPDADKVNTACNFPTGGAGVCRARDGACSTFPYVTRNFDPDTIAVASIGALNTTCPVTFNSTTLNWNPASCISNPPQPLELTQGGAMVLLPLSSLTLGGDLRLVGNRPVILAVYGNVTLNHHILANGATNPTELTTTAGAGGDQSCAGRRGGNGALMGGTGGGGGGAGGRSVGGVGNRGSDAAATGGDAGAEGGSGFTPLVGGCPGGSGGGANSVAGTGGAGGGAVQLSVAGTLTVNAWVTTSGGGGLGGRYANNQGGGGGGGGSGGAVLLEAHQVVLGPLARVTANGGGGGEGGVYHATGEANGQPGDNGPRSSAAQAIGGRNGSSSGGDGGNGGAASGPPDEGKAGTSVLGSRGGGGGGGGAAGFTRLRSVRPCALDAGSIISPPTNVQCPL